MNRAQTAAILALVDSLDPYVSKSLDKMTAEARLRAWAMILDDVPLDFARPYVERYFRQPRDAMLQPAHIRAAYVAEQDRVIQHINARAMTDALAEQIFEGAPPWVRPLYTAARDGDPDAAEAAVRREQGIAAQVTPNDPERACDVRECQCQHVQCYRGFLPDVIVRHRGRDYTESTRCPTCAEAVDVRETLAAEQQPRRRWR